MAGPTLPASPSALLIVNLGHPFRVRAGTDIESAHRRRLRGHLAHPRVGLGYPLRTRSVGVHLKPWGLARVLPMPACELCSRPVTVDET